MSEFQYCCNFRPARHGHADRTTSLALYASFSETPTTAKCPLSSSDDLAETLKDSLKFESTERLYFRQHMFWIRVISFAFILCVLGVRTTPTVVQHATRATCTPASGGSASIDDVPAIESAFKACGSGGIIVIPAGKTYMLRTTLDFTGCELLGYI